MKDRFSLVVGFAAGVLAMYSLISRRPRESGWSITELQGRTTPPGREQRSGETALH
jgi:hypothetical protein